LNRHGGRSSEQGRGYTGRGSSYEQQQCAFRRAEKLQDSLDPENPSFVKTMVRSHVSSCFWLVRSEFCCRISLPNFRLNFDQLVTLAIIFTFCKGLPNSFCKKNLPSREFRMVLEDEEGGEFDAVYIGNRTGLSGGWRGFAMHHNLEDGDSLIFELVEPDRFKVLYCVKLVLSSMQNIFKS
jgi:hypothetical protein